MNLVFKRMHSAIKFFTRLGFIYLLLLGSHTSYAQENNYLQLLEGEASNLILDQQTKARPEAPVNANTLNSITDEGIPAGLSFEEFMNALKVNYIGTYLFAKRLSESSQNEIYTFYQNNNDPQAIRTQVIKISKKK